MHKEVTRLFAYECRIKKKVLSCFTSFEPLNEISFSVDAQFHLSLRRPTTTQSNRTCDNLIRQQKQQCACFPHSLVEAE